MTVKNVCMAAFNFPPHIIGGDAVSAYYYALALAERNINTHVIYDYYAYRVKTKTEKPFEYAENKHINTYPINSFFNTVLGYYLKLSPVSYRLIGKIIREKGTDVFHSHNLTVFGFSQFMSAKKYGLPTFYTSHGYEIVCPRDNSYRTKDGSFCTRNYAIWPCIKCTLTQGELRPIRINKVWNRLLDKIDCIICPSRYMLETIKKFHPERRFIHIPNAIGDELFSTISEEAKEEFRKKFALAEEDKVVLFVGSLYKEKGVDVLIDAFKLLTGEGNHVNNVKLLIVGEGPEEHKLKSKDGKNIIFAGKLYGRELAAAYSICSCFVLPSVWPENNPIVLIEAMACGKPVLGSDVGGIPELINNGKNGLLFRMSDVEDMKEKLEIALFEENKFGEEGREYYEKNHSLDVLGDSLIKLYNKYI